MSFIQDYNCSVSPNQMVYDRAVSMGKDFAYTGFQCSIIFFSYVRLLGDRPKANCLPFFATFWSGITGIAVGTFIGAVESVATSVFCVQDQQAGPEPNQAASNTKV